MTIRIRTVQFTEAVRVYPRMEGQYAKISTHLNDTQFDITLVKMAYFEIHEKGGGALLSIIPFARAVCCQPLETGSDSQDISDAFSDETDEVPSDDLSPIPLPGKTRVKSKANDRFA